MKKITWLLMVFVASVLVGCATVPIEYKANELPLERSMEIIDRMVMTQHKKWRPDQFVIGDKYFGWGMGTVSTGSGFATSTGGTSSVLFSSSTITTRSVSERVYYDEIGEVKLLDWTRKFKQWYVVTLYRKDGSSLKHVFRTRNLEEAQLMVDALDSFIKLAENPLTLGRGAVN